MRFLIFILFIHTALEAQDAGTKLSLTLESSTPLVADFFHGVDDFDNIYISKDNTFYKITRDTQLQFYDLQLGDLESVDLINPLKIMLFYRDTQTIVFVDNRLNETERVVLIDLPPFKFIQYARVAGEKQLWLYNQDEQRLERYDYLNNRTLPFPKSVISPVIGMSSTYNFCQLLTQDAVFTFNSYGSSTSTITLSNGESCISSFENSMVLDNGALRTYQLDKKAQMLPVLSSTALPSLFSKENDPISLYLKARKLYIYARNTLHVYKTNLLE